MVMMTVPQNLAIYFEMNTFQNVLLFSENYLTKKKHIFVNYAYYGFSAFSAFMKDIKE